MTNLKATASGGTYYNIGILINDGFRVDTIRKTITIDHSVITASEHTIQNFQMYSQQYIKTLVGNSKLDGGPVENISPAILTCAGSTMRTTSSLQAIVRSIAASHSVVCRILPPVT